MDNTSPEFGNSPEPANVTEFLAEEYASLRGALDSLAAKDKKYDFNIAYNDQTWKALDRNDGYSFDLRSVGLEGKRRENSGLPWPLTQPEGKILKMHRNRGSKLGENILVEWCQDEQTKIAIELGLSTAFDRHKQTHDPNLPPTPDYHKTIYKKEFGSWVRKYSERFKPDQDFADNPKFDLNTWKESEDGKLLDELVKSFVDFDQKIPEPRSKNLLHRLVHRGK